MRIISVILQIIGISIILFSLYAFTQYDVGIDHAEFGGQAVADVENQRLGTNYTYTEQFFNFWEGLLFGGCGFDISADNCNRTLGVSWEQNRQANITSGQAIDDAMQQVFINSITIFLISFIIYASIGVVAGIIAGVKSGKLDQILHFFTSALIGIPGVLVLIFIFRIFLDKRTLEFNILLIRDINIGSAETDTSILWYLAIPILSHALISLPFVFRYIRSIVRTEMGRPYLRTARAKGLSEFQIVRKHLLPNIYSKMISALAVSIPMGISSIALVEYIYGYNGMFNLMFASIYNYNFPILHAGALYIGVFTFILMTLSNSFAKFMDKLQAAK